MHMTLVRLADYALEHISVANKIVFQFLDEAGVDNAFIPPHSVIEMDIDDQIPSQERAI
jgi:hypothetical protein